MIEISGNLWDYTPVVIPTNGVVRNGLAVMGKGLALEARQRYRGLQECLAHRIGTHGNNVFLFPQFDIYTFPTKRHWREPASPALIAQSANQLLRLACVNNDRHVYLPEVGCGLGGLKWQQVREILEPILVGEGFIIVRSG